MLDGRATTGPGEDDVPVVTLVAAGATGALLTASAITMAVMVWWNH